MIPAHENAFGKIVAWCGLAVSCLLYGVLPADADLLISCPGCASSTVGGTTVITAPSALPPTFTVARNPNDNSGLPSGANLTPLILVPDNASGGASLQFNMEVFAFQGGPIFGAATAVCDLPCSEPFLGLPTEWSSAGTNFLPDYLGDTQLSGPSMLFDSLLAATRAVDPAANGYFVYTPLQNVPVQFAPGAGPVVTFGGIASFPTGTIFGAFLLDPVSGNPQLTGAESRDATGTLLFVPSATVPEPSAWLLVLLAGLMAALAGARRKRR